MTAVGNTGISIDALARLDQHLLSRYIEPEQIAGCLTLIAQRSEALMRLSIPRSAQMRGSFTRSRLRNVTTWAGAYLCTLAIAVLLGGWVIGCDLVFGLAALGVAVLTALLLLFVTEDRRVPSGEALPLRDNGLLVATAVLLLLSTASWSVCSMVTLPATILLPLVIVWLLKRVRLSRN